MGMDEREERKALVSESQQCSLPSPTVQTQPDQQTEREESFQGQGWKLVQNRTSGVARLNRLSIAKEEGGRGQGMGSRTTQKEQNIFFGESKSLFKLRVEENKPIQNRGRKCKTSFFFPQRTNQMH